MFIVALTAAAAACAALAAEDTGQEPPAPRSALAEQLERLTLERPEVPVTKPENVIDVEPPPALPPDGSMVIDRSCRLRMDAESGWIVLEFIDEQGRRREKPRWALPCERLEKMETVAVKHPETVFRLTGESFVYYDRAFLLITKDAVVVTPEPPASAKAPPKRPPATRPATTQPSATTQPATTRPAEPEEKGPTSDDVFEALMRQKPGTPMDTSAFKPADVVEAPSVAPKPDDEAVAKPPPSPLVADKIARVPEPGPSGWREVRFKSDNTLLMPPLRLLPCHLLEYAESLDGEIQISGQVTRYKGHRYLLLRKVLPERDMGQF